MRSTASEAFQRTASGEFKGSDEFNAQVIRADRAMAARFEACATAYFALSPDSSSEEILRVLKNWDKGTIGKARPLERLLDNIRDVAVKAYVSPREQARKDEHKDISVLCSALLTVLRRGDPAAPERPFGRSNMFRLEHIADGLTALQTAISGGDKDLTMLNNLVSGGSLEGAAAASGLSLTDLCGPKSALGQSFADHPSPR